MDGVTCRACHGSGDLLLPCPDGCCDDLLPCPCCRPEWWPRGFPGLRQFNRWIINPSLPGQAAEYVGYSTTTQETP